MVCLASVAGMMTALAGEVHLGFDRISQTQLVLHFDTEPQRSYTVQFKQQQADGSFSTSWTNFYFVASQPFFNHWAVLDYMTNRARIYRLQVSP